MKIISRPQSEPIRVQVRRRVQVRGRIQVGGGVGREIGIPVRITIG